MTNPRNPAFDPAAEWQSAWYDQESAAADVGPSGTPLSRLGTPGTQQRVRPEPGDSGNDDPAIQQRLDDYRTLSQLLQGLPVEPMPADFTRQVLDRLPVEGQGLNQSTTALPAASPRRSSWGRVSTLAASLLGLGTLATLWGTLSPQQTGSSYSAAGPQRKSNGQLNLSKSPGNGLASFPSRLKSLPENAVAIVTIHLPQSGSPDSSTNPRVELAEKVFGEHDISRVQDPAQVVGNLENMATTPPSTTGGAPAKVAFQQANGDDPMLLLVVGESEAIVKSVEDLLHEWEQSQLEEEIVAVARTELDQHSSEMNQSFGQYLAEVEQSWDQTQPESVQVAIRGMQRRSSVANATAASADQRTEDNPSRSRGLLTWLPHESLVGYSNSHSQDMRDSRASHSGALQQQSRIPSENNNRLLEERSDQPALKADAAPESLRRRSGASSPPPAPAAAPQAPPNPNRFAKAEESLEAVPVEGRQIRRVLIRIVPRPAG